MSPFELANSYKPKRNTEGEIQKSWSRSAQIVEDKNSFV